MSKDFDTMKTEVLRNLGYEDDSSTGIDDLLTDIGIWLNNRYREIWTLRTWAESFVEEDIIVPANTNEFSMPSSMQTVVSIRNGTTVLLPIDPSQINKVSASLWTNTGDAYRFYQKGTSGIRIFGQYTTATTMSLFGKKGFSELVNGTDSPCLICEDIIIAGATADGQRISERNMSKGDYYEQIYAKLLKIKVNESENQQAKEVAFRPVMPWTNVESPTGVFTDSSTSKVPL